MNLYDRYVEWASNKILDHILVPIMSSKVTWKVCDKVVQMNDYIAEKTGYNHLEAVKKRDEYNQRHPKKTALKKIAKTATSSLLMGGFTDYQNLR